MATPETSSGASSSFAAKIQNLRGALKKYGRTGIAVYLSLSTCVTAGFYIAIEQHVDVKKILGMKEDPSREPSFFEKMVTGKGSSIALAMICSKAMVPIKLPVAVAITPYVHRWSQRIFASAAKGQ